MDCPLTGLDLGQYSAHTGKRAVCYLRQGGYVFVDVIVFVCLLAELCTKTTQLISTKFARKATRGPQKKPLVFASNPDHVTSMLDLGLG